MEKEAAKAMTPISDSKKEPPFGSLMSRVETLSGRALALTPLRCLAWQGSLPFPAQDASLSRRNRQRLGHHRPKRRPQGLLSEKGFTLLELLLVLTLIGMASVLIFPNVGNLDGRTFNVQVRQAHSLLNHARRDAVVRGQPSTIRLYADEDLDENEEILASNVVGSWQSEGIDILFRDSTDQESEVEDSIDITFFPEGGSTGGTLLLALGEQQARIAIDPFTGRIDNESIDD